MFPISECVPKLLFQEQGFLLLAEKHSFPHASNKVYAALISSFFSLGVNGVYPAQRRIVFRLHDEFIGLQFLACSEDDNFKDKDEFPNVFDRPSSDRMQYVPTFTLLMKKYFRKAIIAFLKYFL